MPIHLRGSTYHLRRRVPKRYAGVEERKIVYVSLKTDSLTEARRKEEEVWNNLVAQWEALLRGDTDIARERYDAARELAYARGYEFLPAKRIAELPLDEIVARVEAGDLVITADIPLAHEAIEKGATALSPRGERYTAANIRARLMMRDFLDTLRASGIQSGGPPPLSQTERRQFANQLDRYLAAIRRAE